MFFFYSKLSTIFASNLLLKESFSKDKFFTPLTIRCKAISAWSEKKRQVKYQLLNTNI